MRKVLAGIVFLGVLVFASDKKDINSEETAENIYKTVAVKKFNLSYAVQQENLLIKVSYPTEGWVSVGFNPTKKMKDANIIIGYFQDGNAIIADHFGVGPVKHQADTLIGGKDNLIASSCTEENGVTTLSFTIPLNSGDDKDGVIQLGEKTVVILAAGRKDNVKAKHTAVAKKALVFQ